MRKLNKTLQIEKMRMQVHHVPLKTYCLQSPSQKSLVMLRKEAILSRMRGQHVWFRLFQNPIVYAQGKFFKEKRLQVYLILVWSHHQWQGMSMNHMINLVSLSWTELNQCGWRNNVLLVQMLQSLLQVWAWL
uniref:Uncharacterized protein LOC103329902 n=1 Tax=Rhizophora mucronata TaxID=61149 RepID=A0A2P2MVG7_RHIMU